MRCFISIDLSEEAQKELETVQHAIFEDAILLNVKPENIHLTLKFFGEIDSKKIESVKNALAGLKIKKFKARLGNIGVFPDYHFIRVVWAGIEPHETINEIHKSLELCLGKLGFQFDSVFESHATISRVKGVKNKEMFIEKLKKIQLNPVEFDVESIKLKKSELTREGPVYEDLFELKLV